MHVVKSAVRNLARKGVLIPILCRAGAYPCDRAILGLKSFAQRTDPPMFFVPSLFSGLGFLRAHRVIAARHDPAVHKLCHLSGSAL